MWGGGCSKYSEKLRAGPKIFIYAPTFVALATPLCFFITHEDKETALYFAPYTAGKDTESSGPNCKAHFTSDVPCSEN